MAQQSAVLSPSLVRLRALHIGSANDSVPVGGSGAADRLHVGDKTISALDIRYCFTPNLAAKLVHLSAKA